MRTVVGAVIGATAAVGFGQFLLWGRRHHRAMNRRIDAAVRLAQTDPCPEFVDDGWSSLCARCGFHSPAHDPP